MKDVSRTRKERRSFGGPRAARVTRTVIRPRPEARLVFTVRLRPSEAAPVVDAAMARGLAPRVYMRECLLAGHKYFETQAAMEGHVRVTA